MRSLTAFSSGWYHRKNFQFTTECKGIKSYN